MEKHAHRGRRGEVILFPDTFNNFFHPKTGYAALELLEAAGFSAEVPRGFHCCGRPLYDYGFLDLAKTRLKKTMEQLRVPLERGASIVVLEPSCATVFRHELRQFFPDDPLAIKLSRQTKTLAELFDEHAKDWEPPKRRFAQSALLQPHCHHHAVLSVPAEERWLQKFGIKPEQADAGCCGMAGAFGFEAEHYDVSIAVGEQKLLPKVRALSESSEVIANGFSCREQIRQGAGRMPRHFAELGHAAVLGDEALGRSFQRATRAVRFRRGLITAAAVSVAALIFTRRRRWR